MAKLEIKPFFNKSDLTMLTTWISDASNKINIAIQKINDINDPNSRYYQSINNNEERKKLRKLLEKRR